MTAKRLLLSTLTLAILATAAIVIPLAAQQDAATPAEPAKTGCAKKAEGAGCAKPGALTAELNEAEQKVIDYAVRRLVDDGVRELDPMEVLEATGVSADEIRLEVVKQGLLAALTDKGYDVAALVASAGGGGYCSKFQACSVDHNLNNASGEELARYLAERADDGTRFTDRVAPDFRLPTTTGESIALSDYRGKNVALVFLSGHCFHSLDTLPILAALRERHPDVEILPVFVNSGSPEDLKTRAWEWEVEYPLVVSETKEISASYDSRMVPSTFLIDEQGRITRKFVGFKDQATLDEALAELTAS